MPGFDIMAELGAVKAVTLDSHFVYASGKHGSGYINMDPMYPRVSRMAEIGARLYAPFMTEAIQVVAGPAVGGVALAIYTATAAYYQQLSNGISHNRGILAVWADKIEYHDGEKRFEFERTGFAEAVRGKHVLVVEDLLTTGGSVAKVCAQVIELGGKLVGVSAVCNRGGVKADAVGAPRLEYLTDVDFSAEQPESCSLCAIQRPIVLAIGHGKKFAAANPDYAGGYI